MKFSGVRDVGLFTLRCNSSTTGMNVNSIEGSEEQLEGTWEGPDENMGSHTANGELGVQIEYVVTGSIAQS